MLYGHVVNALAYNKYNPDHPQATDSAPHQVPSTQAAGLLKLAQARNPVYRLLAVRAAGKVEPDAAKRLAFYGSYINETDPHILREVIDAIVPLPVPASDAERVLDSLEPAIQKTGDTQLASDLAEQRALLQKRLNPPK